MPHRLYTRTVGVHATTLWFFVADLPQGVIRAAGKALVDSPESKGVTTTSDIRERRRVTRGLAGPLRRLSPPCVTGLGETTAVADHRYRARQDHHFRDYDDRIRSGVC